VKIEKNITNDWIKSKENAPATLFYKVACLSILLPHFSLRK